MKGWNNISVSEKLEASRLKGGEKIKVKTIVVLGLVFVTMTAMTATAGAKTYNDYSGHSAVQYEHSDIASHLKPYVDHVEYDTMRGEGHGYGVRLYLTREGQKKAVRPGWVLSSITSAVMSAPEWRDQRSRCSVWTEIWLHAKARRTTIHIEYYYNDLKLWEVPYNHL